MDSSLFVFFIFYLIKVSDLGRDGLKAQQTAQWKFSGDKHKSFIFYLILHSSLFPLPFLYPSCLKDFLFGIVDFLELAFGSPFDIVAKGGYTVGMMLESKLAVGSLDLLVGG